MIGGINDQKLSIISLSWQLLETVGKRECWWNQQKPSLSAGSHFLRSGTKQLWSVYTKCGLSPFSKFRDGNIFLSRNTSRSLGPVFTCSNHSSFKLNNPDQIETHTWSQIVGASAERRLLMVSPKSPPPKRLSKWRTALSKSAPKSISVTCTFPSASINTPAAA